MVAGFFGEADAGMIILTVIVALVVSRRVFRLPASALVETDAAARARSVVGAQLGLNEDEADAFLEHIATGGRLRVCEDRDARCPICLEDLYGELAISLSCCSHA